MPPADFGTSPGITIDLSIVQVFLNSSLFQQAAIIFALGAWVILAFFFLKAGAELWVEYRQNTKYLPTWQWVLLAVDVPPLLIQTPKAVEQIFAHISGAAGHMNVADKFWHGKKQKWFSVEIISIEGYIQFLLRSEVEYRDLVEAAIYAQYPEAEITEVEDYVDAIPDRYPNAEYDVMGVEFKLAEDESRPIRTYPDFQYNLSKDAVFSDPMAAILENFARIGHGENLWMQLIVEPADSSWKHKGIEVAKKLMGQESHHGGGLLSNIGSIPQAIMKEFFAALQIGGGGGEHEAKKEEKKELEPGVRGTVEAIEQKIAKIGLKSKMRILYAARKEAFHPNRCIEGFIGAMNQFHVATKNAIVAAEATHAHYDRTHKKSNLLKNTFVKAFKKRKIKWKKIGGYILNIEELATVWHFPLPFVKTPLLQKAGHKRAEAPSGLPVEMSEGPLRRKPVAPPSTAIPPAPKEPEELPYG